MKKHTGFSKVGIVVICAAVALLSLTAFLITDSNNKAARLRSFATTIAEPNEENGYIGDHVKGSKDAPVVIFEYADFQCGYCALMNPQVDQIVEAANGKLAVVYRNYLLSYHQNGTAAASAAEAAGLQGYWQEYANELFNRQDEWASASTTERTAIFGQYFQKVTNNTGDLAKFLSDMSSSNVSRKINFDIKIGQLLDVSGTPSFFIDGKLIDFGNKNGGEITINNQTFSWEKPLSSNEFKDLILNIVNAKVSE